MTAPRYRPVPAEPTSTMVQAAIDTFGIQPGFEAMKRALRAALAAAPQPEPPANGTFWGWLCNGRGDGWEEKDKVVHDPNLIKMRRERPDLWRIEGLYRAPAPPPPPYSEAAPNYNPDAEIIAKPEPPPPRKAVTERAWDAWEARADARRSEPPADLVERAKALIASADDGSGWYPTALAQGIASLAQEHAAAEKARADKAEKALEDEKTRAEDAERLLGFIHKWLWREDPPGATGKLTDAERLSLIKNHPWWNRIAAIQASNGA